MLAELYQKICQDLLAALQENTLNKEEQQKVSGRMQVIVARLASAAAADDKRPTNWYQRFALLSLLMKRYLEDLPTSCDESYLSATRSFFGNYVPKAASAGDKHKNAVAAVAEELADLMQDHEELAPLGNITPLTPHLVDLVRKIDFKAIFRGLMPAELEALLPKHGDVPVAYEIGALNLTIPKGSPFVLTQLEQVAGAVMRYNNIIGIVREQKASQAKRTAAPAGIVSLALTMYSPTAGITASAATFAGLKNIAKTIELSPDLEAEQVKSARELAAFNVNAFGLQLGFLLQGHREIVDKAPEVEFTQQGIAKVAL